MLEKLDYYDALGVLVPGSLATCWVWICFPSLTGLVPSNGLPTPLQVVASLALVVLIGHIIQTLGSLLEPCIYRTWRGRPSDRALLEGLGDRYLPRDSAVRIRAKLAQAVGEDSCHRSLFLRAMQLAESAGDARVQRFNSLYAYHRGLLILALIAFVLLVFSLQWGAAATWACAWKCVGVVAVLAILVLTWHRAKQRAYYYVREVLLTAERVLDGETRG
ncbi:MAG TPA: hypothetical protein VNA25_20350 [Phycisphaerae bacterium]|nr:hypothetical protein [Phycisphaerae bacterium]